MAKSRDNVVMQGASGRVGRNLVFRQKGDQTIIARRPVRPEGMEYTSAQQRVKARFTRAALYAKKAILDPVLKDAYKAKAKGNQSAYNIALRDFQIAPQVVLLFDQEYMGQVGDSFSFLIKDVLKVLEVQVEILDQNDVLVEKGSAVALDAQNTEWSYAATVENTDYLNAKYRITMVDTPKKRTTVILQYGEDEI